MFLKPLGMFLAFTLCSFWGSAQDCTLDVGGKNTNLLVDVFQLSGEQVSQMEAWRAALEIETKAIEEDIQKLFNEHPQSTPAELTTLADKYKILQQKIVVASKGTDKKLLAIFNQKQYDRYLVLCNEAFRKPIQVALISQKDSVVDPE